VTFVRLAVFRCENERMLQPVLYIRPIVGVDVFYYPERYVCYVLFGGLVDDFQIWWETDPNDENAPQRQQTPPPTRRSSFSPGGMHAL